jgi:hypothetical protein
MISNLNRNCDLHIHSDFSDSDATVESIFKAASQHNLACIALTDHDTVDGMVLARQYSRQYSIELLEGIEMSAQKQEDEVHILGYFLDTGDAHFAAQLTDIKQLRRERIATMADKLNAFGLKIDKLKLFDEIIKEHIPTRLHLARYLVITKQVKSLIEAFRKYLSAGKPGYAGRFKYSVEQVVELIHGAGGLAFLAHPQLLRNQSWIEEFIACGIDGMEVVYPRLSPPRALLYSQIAQSHGLLKSGGSDAHGSYKEFTQIGGVTIPYEWVQEIKARLVKKKE